MPAPIRIGIKDLEMYVEEAKRNIQNDRAITDSILIPLLQTILKEPTRHDLVFTASKLIESLQRSNEQLIRLISTLNTKRTVSQSFGEDLNYDKLFEQIQKEDEVSE